MTQFVVSITPSNRPATLSARNFSFPDEKSRCLAFIRRTSRKPAYGAQNSLHSKSYAIIQALAVSSCIHTRQFDSFVSTYR